MVIYLPIYVGTIWYTYLSCWTTLEVLASEAYLQELRVSFCKCHCIIAGAKS